MATALDIDVVAITSAVAGVTPNDLVAAIATIQAAATFRARVAGAPAGIAAVHPHSPTGLPISAFGMSTLAGPATGADGSFAAAGVVAAPVGAAGPFATVGVIGAPTGTVVGATGTFAVVGPPYFAAVTSAPAGTTTDTVTHLQPWTPSSTHTWAELRIGRHRMPSSRHPSMAFQCSRWDPPSHLLWRPYLHHNSCRP
jgi:hypothetical protein